MARMKNVISVNWLTGGKRIAFQFEHRFYARKKPIRKFVPVYATEWLEKKPGANSWIKRREK